LTVDAYEQCVTTESELKTDFIKKENYEMLRKQYHTLEKHCISLVLISDFRLIFSPSISCVFVEITYPSIAILKKKLLLVSSINNILGTVHDTVHRNSRLMMGMLLGYDGWAQFKACVSLDGFLPAKAKVLRGELLLLLRNLRVSRMTYLPVKPDAPKITMS
nr:hypothetical protein [Tanacetum cinerariifolium]